MGPMSNWLFLPSFSGAVTAAAAASCFLLRSYVPFFRGAEKETKTRPAPFAGLAKVSSPSSSFGGERKEQGKSQRETKSCGIYNTNKVLFQV